MILKNLFYIGFLIIVLISCSKDDPVENLQGKIIFSKVGLPHYYIKDLKTGQITSYDALPHVCPSGTKMVMYNYQEILVTDFSGKQIIYSYKPKDVSELDFLWSPDDNKLAVSRANEINKISIIDLDKKIRSDILMPDSVSIIELLVWPASDNFIYFMSKNHTNHRNSISKFRPDGSEFQHIFTLENDQTLDQGFDFHKASDLIVFSLYDSLSQESRICRIFTNGTDFQTIYTEKTHAKYNFHRLKISPDQQKIICVDILAPFIFDISKKRKIPWSRWGNPHWSSDGLVIMNSFCNHGTIYGCFDVGIQVNRLDQPDGEGNVIEVGIHEFFSWYFD